MLSSFLFQRNADLHVSKQKLQLTLKNNPKKHRLLLLPVAGIIIFVCLYVIAATLYPGGSQADKNAEVFSWLNNYWCNLLNEYAMNGKPNTARQVAFAGMCVLCLSLITFWILFPLYAGFTKRGRLIMQFSGSFAMTIGFFLFTNLHDMIINLAMLCGLIAIAGTFAGLKKLRWKGLILFGIFNLLLVVVNNILYYGDGLLVYLPLVQKITFLSFLLWISVIDIQLYKGTKTGILT